MSDKKPTIPEQKLAEIKNINNKQQAIALIKKLIDRYPQFIPARVELGLIYRRRGDRKLALDTFKTGIEFAPEHQNLRLKLVEEQLECNRLTEAQNNVDFLLKLNPQNGSAIVQLGSIRRKEGRDRESCLLFQQALKINPKDTIDQTFKLPTQIGRK